MISNLLKENIFKIFLFQTSLNPHDTGNVCANDFTPCRLKENEQGRYNTSVWEKRERQCNVFS